MDSWMSTSAILRIVRLVLKLEAQGYADDTITTAVVEMLKADGWKLTREQQPSRASPELR